MGTGRTWNRKPMTRPRKSEAARNQRLKIHKKRLVALGVPEETLKHLTIPEVRNLLRTPNKTQAAYAG